MKSNRRYTNTFSGHKNTIRKLAAADPHDLDDLVKLFEKEKRLRQENGGKLPDWYMEQNK